MRRIRPLLVAGTLVLAVGIGTTVALTTRQAPTATAAAPAGLAAGCPAGAAAVAVGAWRVVSAMVVPIPTASTSVPATSSGRMRRMKVPLGWSPPPGWKLTFDFAGSRSRNSLDAMSAAARIDYRRSSLTTRGLLCVANGLVAALMRDACVTKHRQVVSWVTDIASRRPASLRWPWSSAIKARGHTRRLGGAAFGGA